MNIQFPVSPNRQLDAKGHLVPWAQEFLADICTANPDKLIDLTYQGEVAAVVSIGDCLEEVFIDIEVYCDVCGLHWTLEDPCPYH